MALWLGWGAPGVTPGLVFGALATGIQLLAVRALRRGWGGTTAEFFSGFGAGMALRMAGIVLLFVAVMINPGRFPAVPSAIGYLGVVVPLLFLEARFVR
jgi:hypothetical protein